MKPCISWGGLKLKTRYTSRQDPRQAPASRLRRETASAGRLRSWPKAWCGVRETAPHRAIEQCDTGAIRIIERIRARSMVTVAATRAAKALARARPPNFKIERREIGSIAITLLSDIKSITAEFQIIRNRARMHRTDHDHQQRTHRNYFSGQYAGRGRALGSCGTAHLVVRYSGTAAVPL